MGAPRLVNHPTISGGSGADVVSNCSQSCSNGAWIGYASARVDYTSPHTTHYVLFASAYLVVDVDLPSVRAGLPSGTPQRVC